MFLSRGNKTTVEKVAKVIVEALKDVFYQKGGDIRPQVSFEIKPMINRCSETVFKVEIPDIGMPFAEFTLCGLICMAERQHR